MKCEVCSADIQLLDDGGWPLYRMGGHPAQPHTSTAYFCGAKCATHHYDYCQKIPLKEKNEYQ